MDPAIRKRVLQLNPWYGDSSLYASEVAGKVSDNYVPREVSREGFHDPGKGKLIIGPRQTGKSTFMWAELRHVGPHTVLFLHGEEALVRKWCLSPIEVVRDIREQFPDVRTVFIDEAQHIDNVGLFVKGLVDARTGLNIFVTGSSSYHLGDRIRESLAGRAERRKLLPFSLKEITWTLRGLSPAVQREGVATALHKMCRFGSYPEVWFSENPERVLSNLLEAFVLRDASDRHKLKRPDAMRMLLQLIAMGAGSEVNFSELPVAW